MDASQVNSRALHEEEVDDLEPVLEDQPQYEQQEERKHQHQQMVTADTIIHREAPERAESVDAKDLPPPDGGWAETGGRDGDDDEGVTEAPVEASGPGDATGLSLEKPPTAASAVSLPESYPEGGLAAWAVVLGAWFSMFGGMGMMNTIATYQAYTLRHQLRRYSEGTAGWVFSIYTFLAFFCGVYIGPIFDKYGPTWLIIAGAACLITGLVSLSFCTGMFHTCFVRHSHGGPQRQD